MSAPITSSSSDASALGGAGNNLTLLIFLWSLTSALAGFLFGFDTVVISGAEQKIQTLWHLNSIAQGVVVASGLYGTVLGSLFGGWPTDRFGRKKTLMAIGILFLVSAAWSALATNAVVFVVARVIGGLGIGMSTVVAPLYISEIAPPKYRGRLAGMYQFNIVFGILVAFLSNSLLAGTGSGAWRWMFGVAVIPSVIYTLLCFRIPESPRWLLGRKKDRSAGIAILKLIQPTATQQGIETEADAILSLSLEQRDGIRFWTRTMRRPIFLAFLIAFFNQFSGINAILYFAPRIFEAAHLGEKAALLQSVGIGVTNLIFTFVGLWLIDRLGRRTLLFIGSFGYIASLGLVSYAFFTAHFSIVPICIFCFIAAHAVGQGAVIWVYISEIFPNGQRAEGQSLGSSTHWICAAFIATVFPVAVTKFAPGYVFAFFCIMMVLQLIWVKTAVVETKGKTLEEVQERLGGDNESLASQL